MRPFHRPLRGTSSSASTSRRQRLHLESLEDRSLLSADPWPSTATGIIPLDVSQITANATGFDDSHIWIAVFGQLITTPGPGEVPAPGPTYYLDAAQLRTIDSNQEPNPQSTGLLFPGPTTPDSVTLPSSTLADWGSNLSLPVPPDGEQYTGRIVISAGAPVQAQVAADGSVSSPSAANPTDPSTGTFYDFLEFTITNNGGVPEADIDTSQVDSFGLPLQLQFFRDAAGTIPYPFGSVTSASTASPIVITSANHGLTTGQVVTVSGVQGNAAANGAFNVTVLDANTFQLNGSTGSGAYTGEGFWTTGGGPVGVDAERTTIFSGDTDSAFLHFVRSQILAGNSNAEPFLESYATRPNSATAAITGATNATPIVVTSANHGLSSGDVVKVSGVAGNTGANGIFTMTVVDANTFQLDGSAGNAAYTGGGTWSTYSVPLRLVSPKDVVEALTNTSTDPLNTYFDSTIDSFFLRYLPSNQMAGNQSGGGQTFNITSQGSGSVQTYTGTVQLVGSNYVLRLTTPGDSTNYDIYYPFFTTNLPANYTPVFTPGPAPSWITGRNQQAESPTQMVFACDAVFADNTVRGLTGTQSAVLGDLENSISAAFNRGIVLSAADTWGDTTTWFPTNGIYNYWVQYWHQNGLAINNQAYAFPYDDKFGTSTNLQQNNVGVVKITLGSWSTPTASTTAFTNFPTSSTQSGLVTLSATVAGTTTPTGTVTFYIDGVAVNSTNSGPSPLPQPVAVDGTGKATLTANLPALPDGGHTHTYTVTAVYSGDSNNSPSIASQSLQLTGSLGDFAVNPNPSSGSLATSVAVTTILPGAPTSGSVAFSIVDSNGNTLRTLSSVPVTSNTVVRQVTIPTDLLTFTGDTTTGSDTITNVSSVANLVVGQVIVGAGIPVGATIASFSAASGANTVKLNANATATATGVTLTSDANKDVFRIKAVFGSLIGYGNFSVNATFGSTDTAGASVLGATFSGAAAGTFDKVRLTFSEPIDTTSFTLADVVNLTDPNGNSVMVTGVTPVDLGGTTFDVAFAQQTITGGYTLTTGVGILDLAGNPLDQNQDAMNGQPGVFPAGDQFTGTGTLGTQSAPFRAIGQPDGSVKIVDAVSGATVIESFHPLDANGHTYQALVSVALGDLDNDGVEDLFVAATKRGGTNGLDASKAGKVFVYSGALLAAGTTPSAFINEFRPFATNAAGTAVYDTGLEIAAGDVNGDGTIDLVAGSRGDVGRVAAVSGVNEGGVVGQHATIGEIIPDVFGSTYTGKVLVAAGNFVGDNKAEIAAARGNTNQVTDPTTGQVTTATPVRVRAFELGAGGTTFDELNLTGQTGSSGTPKALKPFAAVTGADGSIIDRNAYVAAVDTNGDGTDELVFAARDTVTNPANAQIRIAVFSLDANGLATPASTGLGANGSYLIGNAVGSFDIARGTANQNQNGSLLVALDGTDDGVLYLDPLTGATFTRLPVNIVTGGMRLS